MSKREQQLPAPMSPFSPAQQPDEGYSEDPLNPANASDQIASLLASVRSPADLPQWVKTNSTLLPVSVKAKLAMALLDQLPTSAVVRIVERLSPRLYIDFIRHLPAEICLKILGYLDPYSLVSVLRTCRAWYDLALDHKLWESLYYLEGWKAIPSEIDAWEARVNAGINNSLGHLRAAQLSQAHASKLRHWRNDEDSEMTDNFHDATGGGSLFGGSAGSSSSAFHKNHGLLWHGDRSSEPSLGKGKGIDRGFALPPPEGRAKRKEPGGTPEPLSPSPPPVTDVSAMLRSPLWIWDINTSRYRANWKHLYNMRRRLESNWELGKYTTFVLPHPDHPEEGHQECVYTLQFDANYLVSGSRDRTMRVWDMNTRRLARPPLEGHNGSVLCLQFDADPAEDLLVSGSSDSNVFIWKFSTGEVVQKITKAHRESVLNVRFDKRILVTSSKDKTIKIFNRRPVADCRTAYPSDQPVIPVGTPVKAYGYEPDVAHELPLLPPFTMIGKLEGHGAAVNAIQVRGRTIVSVSGDRQIKLWNWPEQVCVQTIPAHEKGIACVEFDERRIVSGSSDYDVCIFDALTGLKVASLRGHAHLVRTVQAGFADLPYSRVEDELEAKRVDAEYFRAVEAGEIDHESERRFRRGRRTNAGSSRPADLQCYGAKVPPGGGGGRKYGRIVSGSYDQNIIIWRRDKEGVWKPAHHLRQEEAAEAAYRRAGPNAQQQQQQQQSNAQSAAEASAAAAAARTSQSPASQDISPLPLQALSHDAPTAELYKALIDQAITHGVLGLRQALSHHPGLLVQHSYLQSVIEQEQSPITRRQMRQAVADALIVVQNSQAMRQRAVPAVRLGTSAGPAAGSRLLKTAVGSSGSSASSHSRNRTASGGSGGGGGGSSSHNNNNNNNHNNSSSNHANTSNHGSHSTRPPAHAGPGGHSLPLFNPLDHMPVLNPDSHPHAALHGALASALSQLHPPQAPYNAHVVGQAPPPHPRFAAADYAPARVFKLQFDARKIICCTQAPIIVGWDFCNGNPELEEVARFFATID